MPKIYKTLFLLIFNSAFLIFNCFSQQITFQKIYGGIYDERAGSALQTSDGGYIIVGSTLSFGAGDFDVYIIKTDGNGDILWTKTFGGIYYDAGFSIQQTTDGGYIITGTIGTGGGFGDVYLIKTDANGDSLWTKSFGGPGYDEGRSVQQTTDGGYIIVGNTLSFGAGYFEIYIIKTDGNGDTLWTRAFGGAYDEEGYSVLQTSDGGYIITGATYTFGAGPMDVYLIKTDTIGNSLWTKTFGGTYNDKGISIQQTPDGGYIITGGTSILNIASLYLIKTDTNADVLWAKTFGGTVFDWGTSVQQTTDGGYIIVGNTVSFGAGDFDVYIIKTDENGDTLWTKSFGGPGYDVAYSVQQTTDGGYIISGYSQNFGAGIYDIYLIKTDSLGNSGCNEGSTNTIVSTFVPQLTNPATIVTTPATIVTTPTAIISSGGIVTTLCNTVGISPIPALPGGEGVAIAPNPLVNQSTLTFKNPNKEKFLFTLYDITDRITKSVSTTNNEIILTKGSKQAGVYLFNLVNEKTGERWNGKIVISD